MTHALPALNDGKVGGGDPNMLAELPLGIYHALGLQFVIHRHETLRDILLVNFQSVTL